MSIYVQHSAKRPRAALHPHGLIATIRVVGQFIASLTGVLALPITGNALDCSQATSPSDKAICASPTARKADQAMSKAYFTLLNSLSEQDEKEALIASQRRWLKARRDQDPDWYEDSPGGFSGALERQSQERRALFTSRAGEVPIAVTRMERQRALLKAHPGRLAGFSTRCFIIPPRFSNGIYNCSSTIALQKGDRLCRWDTEWATGHETEVWTVAKVENDKASLQATCKTGYAEGLECPDNYDSETETGWTRTASNVTPAMSELTQNMRPLDPDLDTELDTKLIACLSEEKFPPPSEFIEARPKKHP